MFQKSREEKVSRIKADSDQITEGKLKKELVY